MRFDSLKNLTYSLISPCLCRIRISLKRLENRKVSESYIPESEREICHGSDRTPPPATFYSTICFYYALLREETGSGRGAGGDG